MPSMIKIKGALSRSAVLCAVLLFACRAEQPEDLASDEPSNAAEAKPPLPLAEPPIDRRRLLLAVIRAASSHSEGADDASAHRLLDGKQFEVRLRFGCDGQGPGHGDHGWSVDPDGRTLRVRVVPTLSLNDELVRRIAGEETEAAEGFWLSRPWMLRSACPLAEPTLPRTSAVEPHILNDAAPKPTQPDLSANARQRIGIVQFFAPDDSRAGRRIDQPFEAVKKLKDGERVSAQGFNLVLAGRLRARGDGRVILCAGSGRDRPPDCVVSADIDRVWIEQPEDKTVVAEWSV